jgi:putative oxidoreductase
VKFQLHEKGFVMLAYVNASVNVFARLLLVLIFLMSAAGNKIPNYSQVAKYMGSEGVPAPEILLAGAIVFLIAGGVTILVGFQARIGAALLLIFLILATYYFHDFWNVKDPALVQGEIISFMKNLSLCGAMLFVMVNGSGPGSLDQVLKSKPAN